RPSRSSLFPYTTLFRSKRNLTEPAAPFARLALAQLSNIRPRFLKSIQELRPSLSPSAGDMDAASENAIKALESFRDWLNQRQDRSEEHTSELQSRSDLV